MRLSRSILVAAILLLAGLHCQGAAAQEKYPARPITMIVPFPAGGGVDAVARIVADKLSAGLGQPVVIDNRGGAAGVIGTRLAAKAASDGYTLVMSHTGTVAINPTLYANPGYDPRKDFSPVGLIGTFQQMLVVHPALPIQNVAALIAAAKREPGKLTYGSSGVGSTLHMAMELLLSQTGTQITHVPYKGGIGTPYNDLIGGRLDMHVVTFSNAQPLLKTDKLRALAVTSKERHPGFPDVPTVAERLVPDYDVVSWLGFTSPPGLPPALRDRLYEAFRQAMARPEVKSKLEELGNDTRVSTPAEFRARVEADMVRWRPLAHVINQS